VERSQIMAHWTLSPCPALMPGSTPSRQYFGLAITTRISGEPPSIIIVGIEKRPEVDTSVDSPLT
jgi:hypothetical protein